MASSKAPSAPAGKEPAEGPLVTTERVEDFGVITFHDPRRRNCLSRQLLEGLLAGLARLAEQEARAVILRARPGAAVWSAGHDLRELPLDGRDPVAWDAPLERLLAAVRAHPVPVIGAIEGSVWGGACDLAMTLDLLVGTPTASFALTPARLGMPYNPAGLCHFLGVLPLHVVKEMIFTADPLPAEDALRYGLLNRLVEPERLTATACDLARRIAGRAPLAIRVFKAAMASLTSGPALTPATFERLQALRQEALGSRDFREGVVAFLTKRPPHFTGR